MRIAAIGDLHCRKESSGEIRHLLEGVEGEAEVLVLAGDLTDVGLIEEMEVLLQELDHLSIPIVAVAGNHDHEGDQVEILTNMMLSRGIHVLDGSACEINGVGFVGSKGFCGGFGELRIQPFGERVLKAFIEVTLGEVVNLEKALRQLKVSTKIGILHYSPVKETLEGEESELYPFLGASLLADAFDRHGARVIFHGHAHKGSPSGKTAGNIPVYNVSRFVSSRFGLRPYLCFDV
jgi:Icc-related predicted phosphoesterase